MAETLTPVEEAEDPNGVQVANAVVAFMPLLKAIILEAEDSEREGPEKRAAAADAAEKLYNVVRDSGSIKELRYVPWALVGPILVPATNGLIDILVGLFNTLWGKAWGFLQRYLPSSED